MEDVLMKLLDWVEEASPLVWGIAMKQVYVYAIGEFLWALVTIVAGFVLYRLGKFGLAEAKKDRYSAWDMGSVLAFVGAGTAAILSVGMLIDVVMSLVNPEYYAIKIIIKLAGIDL